MEDNAALLSNVRHVQDPVLRRLQEQHAEFVRQKQPLVYEAEDHKGDESGDSEDELVLSSMQGTVYDTAFAFCVRSLKERRWCSVIVPFLWVVFSLQVMFFLSWQWYKYNRYKIEEGNEFEEMRTVKESLKLAMKANTSLLEQPSHKLVISVCHTIPSAAVFTQIEFLYTAYLYGNLAHVRTLFFQILLCPWASSRDDTVEEHSGSMLIKGLISSDMPVLAMLLVAPKVVFLACLWYLGTACLAYTRHMYQFPSTLLALILLSQLDTVIFETFISSSKKKWVSQVEIVQRSSRFLRYTASWPGELVRFVGVCLIVYMGYWIFRDEFALHYLCYKCTRDCSNQCSTAFKYCDEVGQKRTNWFHHYVDS